MFQLGFRVRKEKKKNLCFSIFHFNSNILNSNNPDSECFILVNSPNQLFWSQLRWWSWGSKSWAIWLKPHGSLTSLHCGFCLLIGQKRSRKRETTPDRLCCWYVNLITCIFKIYSVQDMPKLAMWLLDSEGNSTRMGCLNCTLLDCTRVLVWALPL